MFYVGLGKLVSTSVCVGSASSSLTCCHPGFLFVQARVNSREIEHTHKLTLTVMKLAVKTAALALATLAATSAGQKIPDGYLPLGEGYFKEKDGFSYYFANQSYNPKDWTTLPDVSGELKSKKGGYACSLNECFFEGEKMGEFSGELSTVLLKKKVPTRYAMDSMQNAFFDGKPMKDTMGKLKALNYYYAEDSMQNCFYMGEKMETSGSLVPIGDPAGMYVKDTFGNYFYRGQPIEGKPSDLKILGSGYALSNGKAFYGRKSLGNASPGHECAGLKVFKSPSGRLSNWAQSSMRTFYRGRDMGSSFGQTLTVIGRGYARVGHKFYFKGESIGNLHELEVKGDGYAISRPTASVYFDGKKIGNVMGTFSCIGEESPKYCGASHHWFYNGEKMPSSVGPLKSSEHGYVTDQMFVYYGGEKIGTKMGEFTCVGEFCGTPHNFFYRGKKLSTGIVSLRMKGNTVVDQFDRKVRMPMK